uniref:Uncharacterized protein n=1 Tax=Salarias fasciatus TaxID=181472 RepID=A0A672GW34_SALFA
GPGVADALNAVCQETVWEAFKIFWDRLPERDEYQVWVSRCLDDSVSISDIGEFFSRSDEHRDLVRAVSPRETSLKRGKKQRNKTDKKHLIGPVSSACEHLKPLPLLSQTADTQTHQQSNNRTNVIAPCL